MSGVQVTFTGDAIAAAIVAGMNEEQKGQIIRQALDALFKKPESRGYGEQEKSIIEKAVEDAVKRVAYDVVKEHISKDPEIEAQIRDTIRTAVSEGCTSEQAIDAMKKRVVAAVENTFGNRY